MINRNPLIVFARPTYFPRELVNTSIMKRGCDKINKKYSIYHALVMIKLSSLDNKSIPRIAIMA